jgi:hypothetical protein
LDDSCLAKTGLRLSFGRMENPVWLSGDDARALCKPAVRLEVWLRGEEDENRLGGLISIGGVGRLDMFDMLQDRILERERDSSTEGMRLSCDGRMSFIPR